MQCNSGIRYILHAGCAGIIIYRESRSVRILENWKYPLILTDMFLSNLSRKPL
ncbi:hypothetical protein ASZ90_014502 [hydrocarbon metagenome]|uniref:Uncharacterized protein n=1 Tax=hydrocarbon metagenome TaxID=938273 RepID=A0A0W8F4K6_9ZZZZ